MVSWKFLEMIVMGKDPIFFTEGISQSKNVRYRDLSANFNGKEDLKMCVNLRLVQDVAGRRMVSGPRSTDRVGGQT